MTHEARSFFAAMPVVPQEAAPEHPYGPRQQYQGITDEHPHRRPLERVHRSFIRDTFACGLLGGYGTPESADDRLVGSLLPGLTAAYDPPVGGGARTQRHQSETRASSRDGSPHEYVVMSARAFQAVKMDTLFVLERDDTSGRHRAVCERWTHRYGWELRLFVNQLLRRVAVCCSDAECASKAEAWRADLLQTGWMSTALPHA